MNKDLPPGRELDALIAEKVMGYHRHTLKEFIDMGYTHVEDDTGLYLTPDKEIPEPFNCYDENLVGGLNILTLGILNYSTSISAAWEVVEKLNYLDFVVSRDINSDWQCELYRDNINNNSQICMNAWAKTAPAAICLAALKAVEKE